MIKRKEAPPESAKDLFYMSEFDGHWYWKDDSHLSRTFRGKPIGYTQAAKKPYRLIKVNGVHYYAHRLIFWLSTGLWPAIVDHIDGDTHNNHPRNLRELTARANRLNTKQVFKAVKVVKSNPNNCTTYRVHTRINGKGYHLGTFETEAEAIFAGKFARSAIAGQDINPSLYSKRQVTEMYLLMESGVSMLDVIKRFEPSLLFANQA